MDVPDQPKDQAAPPTPVQVVSGWGPLAGLALIPLLFFLAFHIGAGYLSYQKYGSGFWAFIDFIFAYLYYPYYAFFLAKDPAPAPVSMVGGRSGIGKLLKKMMK